MKMEAVEESSISLPVVFAFGAVFCALFYYVIWPIFIKKPAKQNKDLSSSQSRPTSKPNVQSNKNTSTGKAHKKVTRAPAKHQFSSPDLVSTFKGHTGSITSGAVSANGKGLVTASQDRSLFFYNLRDAFTGLVSSVQGSRTNIPLDHVVKLCWSPDFTALVVHKADSQTLEVLKGTKKSDGTLAGLNKVREFTKPFTERLVGLTVATNGKFIMTCTCNNLLCVWDLHGDLLSTVDTRQGNTLNAALSIDDRLVATAGFTPDVKVFEVEYDKTSNFKSLRKAFELTGHNSSVFCSHFSPDAAKTVTVSKDGTWRLYDTSVDYHQGQLPRLLTTGSVPQARNLPAERPCVVRLSPDTRVVLVAAGPSVYCYSASSAQLVHSVENIYSGAILDVFFDAANQFYVTLGDQQAHLLHNVAGHHATIQDLEVSLKAATYSGLKERIKTQLEAAKKALHRMEQRGEAGSKKSSGGGAEKGDGETKKTAAAAVVRDSNGSNRSKKIK